MASASRQYPKPVWAAILLSRYLRSLAEYRRTGTTSNDARTNVRRLFRLTNGRFNDVAARLDGVLHRPRPLPVERGVLGRLDHDLVNRVTGDLRRDGVHVMSRRLPLPLCDRLHEFALRAPCRVYPAPPDGPELVRFDPDDVRGTWYQVDDQTLHENADVQAFAGDLSLLSIAQAYLGCRPVFTGCTMWWSCAYRSEADGDLAQLFHFDMNHVKFLKLFVYLTDVDERGGPHVFVRGSHRRLPAELRQDRRFTDDEVARHYPRDRWASITGRRGTLFVEDTRGLHKGAVLRTGHRLLLQLQYATSPLGGAVAPIVLNERFSRSFLDKVERYPRTYAARFRRPAA